MKFILRKRGVNQVFSLKKNHDIILIDAHMYLTFQLNYNYVTIYVFDIVHLS